ncbi:hypothetical protein FRX31_002249, partial [Thalictrum thalictroides]
MLPLTALVEGIRNNSIKIIKHTLMYRAEASKLKTTVPKWCDEQIKHNIHMARTFKLEKASLTLYTMFSDAKKCVVDLEARICT